MSEDDRLYLPGILGLIADHLGPDVAESLANERGGRSVYIPVDPKPHCELSKIVGHSSAQEIAQLLGSGTVLVPCGSFAGAGGRRAQVKGLLNKGYSCEQIATIVGLHVRTVYRLAEGWRDPKAPMFDFMDDNTSP